MARQRKPLPVDHSNSKYTKKKAQPQNENRFGIFSYWRRGLAFMCLAVAACVGYMGYLETRVNTPFDDQKASVLITLFL